MCVFTHFRCRLKKKHKKPLLFVCLLQQTSHRRALFLSGETILCTSNRQTNGTGLLSQFYRYLFTFALFFSLSVLLSLTVFLSAFIKLAWLSPARQIPPSLWKDTHLPCSQIPAMFSGNITLLLKSSHGMGRSFSFRAKCYKLFKRQTPKWQSPVALYLHERKTHSMSEWETWERVDVLWIFVWDLKFALR